MAFGFRKSPYEQLRDAYFRLSDDEKSKFRAELEDIDKAEDEREIDKIEEDKADTKTIADNKAEDVAEESEQIGKDIDKAEDMEALDTADEVDDTAPAESFETPETTEGGFDEQVSADSTTEPTANVTEPPASLNEAPSVDYKAMQDTLDGLNAKYEALEAKFAEMVDRYGNNDVSEEGISDVGVSGFGKNDMATPEEDDRIERMKKTLGFKNY